MRILEEELADRARELRGRREAFVHATVVRAQHPTSARAGDRALVRGDGRIDGFVGGSCVQASVREYGLKALAGGEPVLLRVLAGEPSRVPQDGVVEVSNPCLSGGAIDIFLEPELPPARVVVVGHTPVARALALLAGGLDLEVELVDGDAAVPRADDIAFIVASLGADEEPALEAALRAGVPYVALVASEKRGAAVLASLEVDDDARARVHSPAGLEIGATTPGEIALSILAELVAERAGVGSAGAGSAEEGRAPAASAGATAVSAVDPVCGMSVAAVESSVHADHDGQRIYFCCPGCRRAFLKDPERYATSA